MAGSTRQSKAASKKTVKLSADTMKGHVRALFGVILFIVAFVDLGICSAVVTPQNQTLDDLPLCGVSNPLHILSPDCVED